VNSRDPFIWIALGRDAIAFAVAAGTAILLWLRKRSARYWPMTQGRVEHASSFENSGSWLTDVSYSYRVENDFYSGQFQLKSRSEEKASRDVARWKDQNIGVRYSAKKPDISVVRMEDQSGLHPGEFLGH
jgi:hypothetical protein